MDRTIYFGFTEMDDDDWYIVLSLDADKINTEFNDEELIAIEALEEKEIYMSVDGVYQGAPEDTDVMLSKKLEASGFVYSNSLDFILLEKEI